MEHPYTAHIAPAGGPALREGEDYYSSDYEYESDEEEDFDQLPPGGVNETLTKKKFCQSFKLFNQVFDSTKQFESFHRSVSKMKKHIFGVIFGLFLEALPPDTRYRMPQELWEKVWKFTQNSYFRFRDSVPLHLDSTYYRAGLRAPAGALAALERERVRELHAAAGNLHMLLFEVLYKNPSILQPGAMFELEAAEGAQERLARGVVRAAVQGTATAFARLQVLEGVLGEGALEQQAAPAAADLAGRIGAGTFLVREQALHLAPLPPSVAQLDPPSSVIVSASTCPVFAVTGRYLLEEAGEYFGLLLAIISAATGRITQVVHTGHSYQSHLIEVGACGVRRRGGQGWKNHFYLTEDRISFLTRAATAATDTVRVWSFPLAAGTPGEPRVSSGAPLVHSVARPPKPAPSLRHSAAAAVGHTSTCLVVLLQSAHTAAPHSSLSLHSLDSGEALLEAAWPGEDLALSGLSSSRALLTTDAAVHFFSLTAGEVVTTYTAQALGQEAGVEGEAWKAAMDADPATKQFVLHTPTLSAFRVLEWEEREMAAPAEVARGGPVAEAVEGLGPNTRFTAGCLLTNRAVELATTSPGEQVAAHEVAAYTLATSARHNLLTMAADRTAAAASELQLNQVSLRRRDEPREGQRQLWKFHEVWNPDRRPLFLASPGVAAVLLEDGATLRLFDFTLAPQEVALREAEWLAEQGEVMEEE